MNILHITNKDTVGGRFNGYSMMLQSSELSCNMEMAVWSKRSENSNVHIIPPVNQPARFISEATMHLSSRIGFDTILGSGGWTLPKYDYFKRADLIHLHLIHGFANFSILSLPKLSRLKPLVWTLHDPWAITGGCEHSFECVRWLTGCSPRCPHPRYKSLFQHYVPSLHWRIKKRVYQHTNVTLVVASKWMKDRIARSPLLGDLPCYQIPFGIDIEFFKPKSKTECRNKLGIPLNHKVIAFRDVESKLDKFKGRHWLMESLNLYEPDESTSLLIFENGEGFKILSPKYNVIRLGWIDGDDLVTALSAADILLMPSIQESFGLLAVESMSCGTPVIVFEGTALPDVIRAPLGGMVVPAKDSVALARVIKKVLNDDALRNVMGKQARQIAESEYAFPMYFQRHLNLYKEAIDRNHK